MNEIVRGKNRIDFWLLGLTYGLLLVGLLAIYDATPIAALRNFGDKLYFFKNQLTWIGIGTVALTFFSFFDYHKLIKHSSLFLGATVVLLFVVLIPHIGTQIYGARRWINIGSFNFQPSEVAKLSLAFYSTAIMVKLQDFKIKLFDMIIVYFLPVIVVVGLVTIEPDLGTALILLAIAAAVYFVGRAPIWHFLISIPFAVAAAVGSILVQPYRLTRLKSFLDPSFDPQGASYQINQILSAITAGGVFGVGIGASRAKFAFIPEVQSDAILAIIIEELGFLGALFLIILFMILIYKALGIAKEAKDAEGRILAAGMAAMIAVQSLFNFASVVALVPLTGIPLPFISYGGSSLAISLAAVGVLLNISRHTTK